MNESSTQGSRTMSNCPHNENNAEYCVTCLRARVKTLESALWDIAKTEHMILFELPWITAKKALDVNDLYDIFYDTEGRN